MNMVTGRDQLSTTNRRTVLKGLGALGSAGQLSAVLATPALAEAVAETLETVTLTTEAGQTVRGSLALPQQTAHPAPAIVLFHEWWGLNDNIKTMAAELAAHGYLALAVDLYKGSVATTPGQAQELMGDLNEDDANDTATSWINWLKADKRSTGKVATIGWCLGGGWSLNASLLKPVDATIIYYGRVTKSAQDLATLKGPVMGHFGELDGFINKKMVDSFETEMTKAGKEFTTHWYAADHAFANPTSARYDEPDASLAWSRSLAFLENHMAQSS